MPGARTAPRSFASCFNIRHNWTHLARRPGFQQPVIDGVRAIAVLWVVLYHVLYYHAWIFPAQSAWISSSPITAWVANGPLGVDLFFVISGFLIGSILFGEWKTTGGVVFSRFYVRRFLRLIPVYCAVILIGFWLLHHWNARSSWANLLYINNFLPVSRQYLPWCWSLAIEEQFYLLFPACILLFMGPGKGRVRLLVALMVLSPLIRFAVIHFYGIVPPFRGDPASPALSRAFDLVYDKPWMRFGGLLAGATGAYLSAFFRPQLSRFFAHTARVTVIAVACAAIVVTIAYTSPAAAFFDRIPYLARELTLTCANDAFSLSAMFLILGAIHTPRLFGGLPARFLSWKGFYPIAQLSYSIYLVHEMIFLRLFPRLAPILTPRLGAWAAMAAAATLGLVVVFGLAAMLYVLIERPSMRLRSYPAVTGLIDFLRGEKLQPQLEDA